MFLVSLISEKTKKQVKVGSGGRQLCIWSVNGGQINCYIPYPSLTWDVKEAESTLYCSQYYGEWLHLPDQ